MVFNWTHVLLSSSRCPHSFQQQCSFRRASRKPESKKVAEDLGPSQASEARAPQRPPTPHWEQPVPPDSPRAFGRLLRPLVFTVGVRRCSPRTAAHVPQKLTPCQFTGSAFGSAAIWQYESLKSRVQSYFDEVQADWLEKLRPQKRGDVRREVRTPPNTAGKSEQKEQRKRDPEAGGQQKLAANTLLLTCL